MSRDACHHSQATPGPLGARTGRVLAALGVVGMLALVGLTGNAWGRGSAVAGLPAGVAAAALRLEPALPAPTGWKFPNAFSRTSGTGRTIGGAFEWTDWVYDDYGASTPADVAVNTITASADALAPARGDDIYPSGPADDDGADIFRAAVGLTRTATIWRVDWNTLVDPSVPLAEWTFDTDDNSRTGASEWPAQANVSSPGIERALVVSARGAELIDAITGRTIATFRTTVDAKARSFLVSVPRKLMPVRGRWRIRLAAGLANPSGTAFAVPTLSGGAASASAPRVYNITFRTAAQEPAQYADGQTSSEIARLQAYLQAIPELGSGVASAATALANGNAWSEDDQADTLATGDVSKFSQVLDWRGLAEHKRTNPPLVTGWSDRWYVTDLNLGQGVSGASEANPAFLGRVQPYAVYIPTDLSSRHALPLTWMLHSADANYNQYGAINPRLVQEECQARNSICASSEGFGGDGLYVGIAEQDFWQIWRQVALAYKVDANRTVMSGYSMGGLGSFVLPTTYPSDFSESMPLDGGFDDGCSSASGEGTTQFDLAAAADRTANVRWVPFVISNSDTDELSPSPIEVANFDRYLSADDRVTLFSTSTPEHVTTDLTDGFSDQIAALAGTPAAATDPGTIDYTWCPDAVNRELGLGPTHIYWLSAPVERDTSAGSAVAHIVADDAAIPEPPETEHVSAGVVIPPDAPAMLVTTGSWRPGALPTPQATLALTLTNVAGLTVDTAAAKLRQGTATVTTDGPTTLALTRLPAGTVVHSPTRTLPASRRGEVVLRLSAGVSRISWSGSRQRRRGRR